MMFNGLVRYPPGNQVKLDPDIAESWSVAPDKKAWTFKLRKGVFFHPFPGSPNGYELTSEDVVFSLKRAANKDTSAYAGDFTGITFEAGDPLTVKITIDKPISDPLFLAKFANYAGGSSLRSDRGHRIGSRPTRRHRPVQVRSYELRAAVFANLILCGPCPKKASLSAGCQPCSSLQTASFTLSKDGRRTSGSKKCYL
jgi:hypothetical protein